MKKKEKKFNRLFIMSALVFFLSACGTGNKTAPKTAATSAETSQAAEAGPETANKEAAAKPADVDAAGNQVLCEQAGIRVTANGFEPAEAGAAGPVIPVTIENDTKTNITVQVKSLSVNGYMQDCIMNTSVPAGELLDSEIILITDSLNRCGIEEVAAADIALRIFDDAAWKTVYDSDPVTFTVKGMENYVQSRNDAGEVLLDENRIKIVSRGLNETEGLFGPQVMLYIENNTEQNITVQAHDALVNQVAVDPMLSTEIMAGKKTVFPLSFMGAQLAENNIETMDSLEIKFHVFDRSQNTIVDTDSIAVKLK